MFNFLKNKEQDPYNGKEARKNTEAFLKSSGTQKPDSLETRPQVVENKVSQPPVQSVIVEQSLKLPDDYVNMTEGELRQLRETLQGQRRSMAYKLSGGGVRGGRSPVADSGNTNFNGLMLGLDRMADFQKMVGSTNDIMQLIDTIDYFLEQGKYRR